MFTRGYISKTWNPPNLHPWNHWTGGFCSTLWNWVPEGIPISGSFNLVGGFKHFVFSIINKGESFPLTFIFLKMVKTTNQIMNMYVYIYIYVYYVVLTFYLTFFLACVRVRAQIWSSGSPFFVGITWWPPRYVGLYRARPPILPYFPNNYAIGFTRAHPVVQGWWVSPIAQHRQSSGNDDLRKSSASLQGMSTLVPSGNLT